MLETDNEKGLEGISIVCIEIYTIYYTVYQTHSGGRNFLNVRCENSSKEKKATVTFCSLKIKLSFAGDVTSINEECRCTVRTCDDGGV